MTEDRRDFDQFCQLAIEGAKMLMHMAYNIETDIKYRQVMKNNGPQDAFSFERDGENVSPTVYLKNYYERYKAGEDIESIIHDLTQAAYHGMEQAIPTPELTQEEARRCVRLDLVNLENNKEMLSNTPYFTIGEGEGALAAYPRWEISPSASFRVTEDICSQIGLVPDEVLQIATKNTQDMEYKLESIGTVLHQLMGDISEWSGGMDQMLEQEQAPQMLVLSTPGCCHGASAVLNQDAMEQAKMMLGCDTVYIIPSSIFEVLIVPGNDNTITPDILKDMIMDVNSTQLAPEDILSNIPLKYDTALSLAIEEPEMKLEHDISKSVTRKLEMSMM